MKDGENDGANGFSIEGLVEKLGAEATVRGRRMVKIKKKYCTIC